jgi:hypothetical protein
MQGGVRTMEVIVMKIDRQEGSSMVTGGIGTGISPLAGDGLDEAFGLAIGLRTIGFGEEVTQAEFFAGGGEELGTVSGAAIGQDTLDVDAMRLVEGDGLVERREDAGGLLVGLERGESNAGMIVDGDVEAFDAGTRITLGAITRGPDAGAGEAAQLLDVEVEEVAGSVAFIAEDRRFGRLQGGEAVEMMAAQNAGEGGFGDGQNHHDLGVGAALATEGEDLRLEIGGSPAGLTLGSGGVVLETLGKAGLPGASQPAADGLFTNAMSGGGHAQSAPELDVIASHLGSHQRGEFGISVHVVRAGGRGVECSSTTSLPDPFRADNLLKHDT